MCPQMCFAEQSVVFMYMQHIYAKKLTIWSIKEEYFVLYLCYTYCYSFYSTWVNLTTDHLRWAVLWEHVTHGSVWQDYMCQWMRLSSTTWSPAMEELDSVFWCAVKQQVLARVMELSDICAVRLQLRPDTSWMENWSMGSKSRFVQQNLYPVGERLPCFFSATL